MTDDLSDLYAELRRLRKDVDRLQTATPLQNSSVGRGRLRFFNNSQLLIQDSNLDVTGTATIIGTLRTVGRIILEGLGILTVNGLIELLGRMRVNGGGGITVEGGGDIVVDGGMIKAADVEIRDGKVYIASMVLDPAVGGGALTFPNGSRLEADGSNAGERLIAGDAIVNVGAVASIRKGPSSVIVSSNSVTVNAASGGDINMVGSVNIPAIPFASGTGLPLNVLLVTAAGYLRRSDGT